MLQCLFLSAHEVESSKLLYAYHSSIVGVLQQQTAHTILPELAKLEALCSISSPLSRCSHQVAHRRIGRNGACVKLHLHRLTIIVTTQAHTVHSGLCVMQQIVARIGLAQPFETTITCSAGDQGHDLPNNTTHAMVLGLRQVNADVATLWKRFGKQRPQPCTRAEPRARDGRAGVARQSNSISVMVFNNAIGTGAEQLRQRIMHPQCRHLVKKRWKVHLKPP